MKPPRQQGFILIYVVGMLAAISAVIYHSQQNRNAIPRQLEKHVQQGLQSQEIDSLLNFVILAATTDLPEDPRYARYKDILRRKNLDDVKNSDELAMLKAMLAQVGFNIDLGNQTTNTALKDPNSAANALARFPLTIGTHQIKLGDNSYLVDVSPGNLRPNLNAIPYLPLWQLLRQLGMEQRDAQQLAANIIDWRDADSFRSEGLGKEGDHYRGLNPPYDPPNKPIATWQELAYMDGVTPETLNLLRENFSLAKGTVYAMQYRALTPEKLGALLEQPTERARSIIDQLRQAETMTDTTVDHRERVLSQLGDTERQRFDAGVTWGIDTNTLRITVSGSDLTRTLDYDVQEKKVIARW
jgi:hypothetical protein